MLGVDGGAFGSLLLRQPLILADGLQAQPHALSRSVDGPPYSRAHPDFRSSVGTVGR
jgi:hypothetical protein